MTQYNLSGKIALVTGGSRGIGRSIVQMLSESGATVAFTYRSRKEEADSLVAELQSKGGKAVAFQSDAANTAQSNDVVQGVIKEFGRLDILVNNAGITKDGLLMRMSEQDWDDVIATNLKSVFNFTKAAVRQMMSQQSGKIINISSVVGITGNAGQANYVASKAGVIGFTKSIAKEIASRNVQVNAIAPGFIETEMTEKLNEKQKESILGIIPMRRMAKPEEVASVVCFLASDGANYITGQTLCVDGGMVM
ncbi:MAG: 3-oxoacyl-[acyl-carrier-protein] reductase [Ignavibacteriales bacterium]|nr:3-oxoacyl-[acyl-carrier-protein] reductase [Ignavibacteriales bacterium]